MKKLALVLFVVIGVGIISCNKEEQERTVNNWLSISSNTSGARYIVDSADQPFHLFGMARCQSCRSTENPDYGGVSGVAQHFKELGCNSIRLALSFNTFEANDLIVQSGGYNETGIQNYITKYVDPEVQAIINKGMYIVLDLHEYPQSDPNPANNIQYARDHFIPVWTELAKRYKDEPMIAMYELWNEPYPADQGSLDLGSDGKVASGPYQGYDWAAAVRKFYIDCAEEVRQYDTQHILLLSDFNSGWGTGWGVTWDGKEYAADPVYKNIMYSVHADAGQLETDFSYYNSYWANLATNNNIALSFGEVELEGAFMNITAMQNFVDMLNSRRSTHHYSAMLWRPHDDVSNYVSVWSDFAKGYSSVPDVSQW